MLGALRWLGLVVTMTLACSPAEMPPILDEDAALDVAPKDGSKGDASSDAPSGCTVAPDGGCNALQNCGAQIDIVQIASDPPTQAAGGTLVAGTYNMTDYSVFTGVGGQTNGLGWFRETMTFVSEAVDSGAPGDASVLQQFAWNGISASNSSPTNATSSGTATFDSNNGSNIAIICPSNASPFPATYTATSTSLIYFLAGGSRITFTKQ